MLKVVVFSIYRRLITRLLSHILRSIYIQKKDITRIEIPYNWLIDKIFSKKIDINNIDKIVYRSMLSLDGKNNQFINDIHFTFYARDEILGTMLLSQYINN